MIGFEIEICLPVADQAGDPIAGDTLLAASRTVHGYGRGDVPIYTLVSDYRSLPTQQAYSNLEFVTKPWRVVGDARLVGPVLVENTLGQIRQVRDALYEVAEEAAETEEGTAPLDAAAATWLNYTTAGKALLLTPGNGYEEEAGTEGNGDGLYPHYSVGVPLGGMPYFLDRLREAAPVVDDEMLLPQARHRLVQAKAFAASAMEDFRQRGAGDGRARERRELDGYLQFAFTQIAAFADYVAPDEDEGQIKNGTVLLSRAVLAEVFAQLSAEAQSFLRQRVQDLITKVSEYQEDPYEGPKLAFRDRATRAIVANAPVSLVAYAQAAFNGRVSISQERVFGGMREVSPHEEEEAMMIPFEIRTLRASRKTWGQLSTDLADLCTWAQAAYERGRV
ncbi:hypothetical protein [Kitasatospora sp. NPDC004289]